jgi:alanyl-tRNA synthetase
LRTPTEESIQATESLANEIVLENRPMRIHLLTEDEAGRLPLRKETEVRGIVRVIEIEDFDWTPCGGTHASRTGEIGMVAVRSFARVKGMTRVEFVCGYRALNDYRRAHGAATAVARLFSAERESIPELVAKSIDENRSLRKRISRLAALALVPEAQELLSTAIAATGFKVVAATFQQREREEMRALATKLVQLEPCVVLLCATDEAGVRLVYARTSSLTPDMSSLMAESCRLLNGRGGGKPDLAQGGGPDRDRLDDALGFAMKRVLDGPG